jgi:DNA-binding response OmpR family regulator
VSPKKILLIDDSSTMLLMEQMALNSGGYQILTAKDGTSGLQAAQSHRPDLILLDVMMPGMDGFEVCRQLRALEATRRTPVLMVTTRSEAANVDKGYDCGCTGYVTKPINNAALLSKVKELLGD